MRPQPPPVGTHGVVWPERLLCVCRGGVGGVPPPPSPKTFRSLPRSFLAVLLLLLQEKNFPAPARKRRRTNFSLSLSFAVPPPLARPPAPGKGEREAQSSVVTRAHAGKGVTPPFTFTFSLSLSFRPTCVTSYYGCALPTGKRECKRRPALALIFFHVFAL